MSNNDFILLFCIAVGIESPLSPTAFDKSRGELMARGYIHIKDGLLTQKGLCYIDAMKRLPQPVEKWVMP